MKYELEASVRKCQQLESDKHLLVLFRTGLDLPVLLMLSFSSVIYNSLYYNVFDDTH